MTIEPIFVELPRELSASDYRFMIGFLLVLLILSFIGYSIFRNKYFELKREIELRNKLSEVEEKILKGGRIR